MKSITKREEYHPEEDSRYIAEKIFYRKNFSANDRLELDDLLIKINEGHYLTRRSLAGRKNASDR